LDGGNRNGAGASQGESGTLDGRGAGDGIGHWEPGGRSSRKWNGADGGEAISQRIEGEGLGNLGYCKRAGNRVGGAVSIVSSLRCRDGDVPSPVRITELPFMMAGPVTEKEIGSPEEEVAVTEKGPSVETWLLRGANVRV